MKTIALLILLALGTALHAAEPPSVMVLVGDYTLAQQVQANKCAGTLAAAQNAVETACGLCLDARGEVHVPWFCESPDLDPEHADQRFTAPYIAIEYAQGPVPQIEAIYQGPTHYVCTRPIPADLERYRICLRERVLYRPGADANAAADP